mmetsp:Transcript_9210/g.29196  ORF Transcript_9210/g.29196 Transcript_9210/m.29196 type:complete len:278 (-) Transcript_9210:2-835(-)
MLPERKWPWFLGGRRRRVLLDAAIEARSVLGDLLHHVLGVARVSRTRLRRRRFHPLLRVRALGGGELLRQAEVPRAVRCRCGGASRVVDGRVSAGREQHAHNFRVASGRSRHQGAVAARAESVDGCASVKQELADRLVLHVVERCLIVVAERAAQVDVSAMGEKDLAHGLVVANDGVVEWRKLVRLEFDEPVGVVALLEHPHDLGLPASVRSRPVGHGHVAVGLADRCGSDLDELKIALLEVRDAVEERLLLCVLALALGHARSSSSLAGRPLLNTD